MTAEAAALPTANPRRLKPGQSRARRAVFGTIVLGLMLLLCAPLFTDFIARRAPKAGDGAVSFAGSGGLSEPVELAGEWRITWLGGPGSAVPPGMVGRVWVPSPWTEAEFPNGATPGAGRALFELTVSGLRPGNYTLHVPVMFAANRIHVDGQPVSQRGQLGSTAETTRYYARSHEIALRSTGAPVKLGIEVASFHYRDRGPGDPPVLGLQAPMRQWIALEWSKDLLFHAALLLLAATTMVAFLIRRQDRASLYLSLAALAAIPGTAVLSYDNLLLMTLPGLSFTAMLAFEYLGIKLAVMFFLAYSRALFPAEFPRPLFWALEGVLAAVLTAEAIAFALGDTNAVAYLTAPWPFVSGASFLTIVFVAARAALNNRDGAMVFLLGIAVFTFLFVSATMVWNNVVPRDATLPTTTLALGMLMLLFSHFVVVAERWALAITAAEQTSDDLRELIEVSSAIVSEMQLKALLARVLEATSRILNADRSSLLLFDARTNELWSMVAEGLSERELRFPADRGLAGHAFIHGETLNIKDAYADPRFMRELDTLTGYETHSILTMPVATRDGRRLGVLQALNRRDGEPFNESDIRRMAAFAAQAAIAIDNATLFSEVTAQQNYNESILRSMSSGVVTLDREGEAAKLNAAARRLLELAPEGGEDEARTLLALRNPQLWAEIEAVSASGEGKSLLDADLITATGATKSANISIVPLMGEQERVGLLVLIDNISDAKRLESAMRRFMTQEVVDQVLAQGDDRLFGTAAHASVLFADIRNFTGLAEQLSPRETVDVLNEVFTDLFEAVSSTDGVLDKFIGDAVMAVWGAPISTGRDAENAVASAVQMLGMIEAINTRRAAAGLKPMRLGVGIATGEVVAGTIGSPKRVDYTVIGDSVNLAARLEALTKSYGVELLVCEATAEAVGATHRLRELDQIIVRGRQRPARIFEVLAERADAGDADALIAAYQSGRDRMALRDWNGAVEAFSTALAQRPDDRPSQLMLERARMLAERPPEDGWDGVWRAAS